MTPALFVEFGFKALGWPRFGIIVIAPRTRLPRAAAVAGALALEGPVRMVLTHPTGVVANGALHENASLTLSVAG
jgi:hypothetical protein